MVAGQGRKITRSNSQGRARPKPFVCPAFGVAAGLFVATSPALGQGIVVTFDQVPADIAPGDTFQVDVHLDAADATTGI